MEIDEGMVQELVTKLDSGLTFTLNFPEQSFPVDKISISKVTTPVTKRTQRGGVYFSDVEIFRIKAQISNKNIIPLISKSMLGPNTEFADLQLITEAKIHENTSKIILHTNLTNSVENSSYVELSLTLTGTEIN